MKNGTQDNGAWLDVLKDLTPKALESGMERLKALSAGDKFCDFAPNPLQFKALCLSFYEDLRLPSTIDAYREIRSKINSNTIHFTHPVIKFVAGKLDVDFLTKDDDAKTYADFKEDYEKVCLLVKQGHELPPLSERPLVVRSQTKAIGQAHLAQMKRLLGVA